MTDKELLGLGFVVCRILALPPGRLMQWRAGYAETELRDTPALEREVCVGR